MDILELIWDNLVDIILGILLIKNTAGRNAKKQAKYEEATAENKVTEKRNRLNKLRNEDKELEQKLKSNLNEEIKLEKELGENGQA